MEGSDDDMDIAEEAKVGGAIQVLYCLPIYLIFAYSLKEEPGPAKTPNLLEII